MTTMYRVTSLIINSAPPYDHHRALGIVLLQGPKEELFLMSEVQNPCIPVLCKSHPCESAVSVVPLYSF